MPPNVNSGCESALSLRPLVLVLKKMIAEGKPGARRLYQSLVEEIEARPELLRPITDPATLGSDVELVETLLSTIFPPSTSTNQGMYAISPPFEKDIIYASPAFRDVFLPDNSTFVEYNNEKTNLGITRIGATLAYNLILNQFYNLGLPLVSSAIHPFVDESGLTRYYDLKVNAQFIEVKITKEGFKLPQSLNTHHGVEPEELKLILPLENFRFEGLTVVDVADVTQEQVMIEIKSSLLNINSFADVSIYDELQQHVRSLIGLKQVEIGITPFFKMNNYLLYTEALYKNSLLFKHEDVQANRDAATELVKEIFEGQFQPVLYESLNEEKAAHNQLLKYYLDQNAKSLIICPLRTDDGTLIGLLEIASLKEKQLQIPHLARVTPAIALFTLALEKSNELIELQIDKMIKEHFTAIQSAVEWKFTEAAFNYVQQRQVSDLAKMSSITFENVYPLYAAIDVRRSSTERNHSIQLDILEQLNMAKKVLEKAGKIVYFPLLKETEYRIEKYINNVTDSLLSDDELLIYDFLQNDLDGMFRNLRESKPELKKWIDEYFTALDPQRGVYYHHRKEFEDSITRINDVLDRFIDQEQKDAQEIYPHYFERYVTDGIEFNIYIGQSLSPQLPFNEMYVRNLKLWQLTLLVKAARVANTLEKRLSLPLQTTQLILAHSIPLSISFRRKERKFDVDGAYNIRYEIMKKRIDKVHLKDSEERLTQPGRVAIVYSQHKELEEYIEFIEYLQTIGLLGNNVEHLELEDTQGISGLRALRVDVNFSDQAPVPKVELSSTTSEKLLRK